jgi:hypothetical protein
MYSAGSGRGTLTFEQYGGHLAKRREGAVFLHQVTQADAATPALFGIGHGMMWRVPIFHRKERDIDATPPLSPADGWLVENARVVHTTFDTGTVQHIGEHKGAPAIWIDFDAATRKLLAAEYALPHLRPAEDSAATTPPDSTERCDYCGGRPVVVSVAGPTGTQRCCEQHRKELAAGV